MAMDRTWTNDGSQSPGDQALAAMDEAIDREETQPSRPPVARLVSNSMTDAERAADFKRRLYDDLLRVGQMRDAMKAHGLTFNLGWGDDTFGRRIPVIQVIRIYP